MKPLFLIAFAALAFACRTPDGPHIEIPVQDLETAVPDGMVRVVFFNKSNKALYPTSGSVRIQLNGESVPTVHHNRYTQVFLAPGRYELLLEHWDLAYFTSRYTIELGGEAAYFAVFSRLVSTGYRQVPELPPNFTAHWSPAKHPEQWLVTGDE
jgi:hypothetical protein